MRNGYIRTAEADSLDWSHTCSEWDIMAYRIHSAEQDENEFIPGPNDALEAVLALDAPTPVAKYLDGPLQWRDRIREIDAAQEASNAAHKAATDAREAERAAIVQRLADEGLVLLNVDLQTSQEAPQEDMSDPANWRAGDLVTSLEETKDVNKGSIYQLAGIFGKNVVAFRDNAGDMRNRCAENYKWHSRPSKE